MRMFLLLCQLGFTLLIAHWTQAICPGSPWQEWRGNCYRLAYQPVPWHGARGDCKRFFRSSDVASIASKAENDFIQKSVAEGQPVWLGMRTVNNLLSWLDGSAVNYRNFPSSRPQTSGAQDVVQMDRSGRWRFAVSHTAPAQRGVCKMPSCACPAGWQVWDRRCYRAVRQPKSWLEARQHCKKLHPTADLVSIINERENEFTFQFLKQYPFWIGLNDREGAGKFTWSSGDKSPYRNWHPPTEPNGVRTCAEMLSDKKWADTACHATVYNLRLPFVCEMIVCGRDEELRPRAVRGSQIRLYQSDMSVRCPPGWTLSDDRCYKRAQTRDTFSGTQHQCQNMHPSSQIALLRTIHDNDRVFFEADSLPMWVDYGSRSGRALSSSPPSQRLAKPTFTYWEPGVVVSRSVDSDCAGMQTSSQWRPQRCERDRLAGLCELPGCKPVCGAGWTEFEGQCYRVLKQHRTLSQQAATCQRQGGQLASVHSQDENDFIATLALPSTGDYRSRFNRLSWIGATRTANDAPWRWTDCSEWNMDRWRSTRFTNTVCGTLIFNGRWAGTVGCKTDKYSAVCKMDPCAKQFGPLDKSGCQSGKDMSTGGGGTAPIVEPGRPQTSSPRFHCLADWRLLDGYCYLGVKAPSSFLNALHTCTDNYRPAQIASAHNNRESALVLELTGGGPAWLGLTAVFECPEWSWMDGSEVGAFSPWASGEPSGSRRNMKLCAATDERGVWRSHNCLKKELSYVCKLPAATRTTTNHRCPDDTNWREEGDNCYLFHYEAISYGEAVTACTSRDGSRLPVIKSARQEEPLQRLANGHTVRLGLTNDWPDGSWRWQDGSLPTYTNWLSSPPPEGQGVLCASLDSRQGGWGVQNCADKVPFYCHTTASPK